MNTHELTIFIQTWLKKKGLYSGRIDGDFGPKTSKAISQISEIPKNWSNRRKLVGTVQYICLKEGEKPGKLDGFYGPSTDNAYKRTVFKLENNTPAPLWRPEEIQQSKRWPKAYTSEFDDFYGKKATNLERVKFPYPMRIAWNPNQIVHSTLIHAKVKDSAERVFAEVLRNYGIDQIKKLRLDYFGGCFNDRPIRGGSRPSMHSWAVALDFDPINNQLRWGRDKATFAKQEYEAWWKIWEAEGWTSLGRQRNFDWMHVQAADI